MGTISEKLTYLNDTRLKIKDELNKFGADLTENDTFRSYSNVLNDIYDKLPKVSGNGSNFTLENVQNGKLDLFEMEGNTHQDSYTGKNLLDINSLVPIDNTTQQINGSSLTITSTRTWARTQKTLTLKANTSYTLMGWVKGINGYNAGLLVTNSSESYQQRSFNSVGQRAFLTVKFDTSVSTELIIQLYSNWSGTTANTTAVFEKVMLLEGTYTTEQDYEPFVGGSPSPSPDFPQEVKVVENEQVVNVHGKNLLDLSQCVNGYIRNDGTQGGGDTNLLSNYIKVNSESNYIISLNTQIRNIGYAYFDENKTYISSSDNNNTSVVTKTIPNNVSYIRVWFNLDNSTALTPTNILQYQPMIEESSTATTYEPYQSQDYEIDLGDIKLCKIEDYQDVIFKNNQLSEHYDSTLDEDSWYIKKEIGKVVLDGSENYYSHSIDDNIERFQLIVLNDLAIPQTQYYSNNFKYMGEFAKIHEAGITSGVSSTNSRCFIFIDKTIASTTTEFKTWLSTHNTIIYYVLDTPTYEKITDETLINQLEAIETETGTNIFEVSNDNDVLPSLNVKRLKDLEKLS